METAQEERRLSLYKDIMNLGNHDNIYLTLHEITQKIYVKKILTRYNSNVYRTIKQNPHPNLAAIIDYFEQEKDRFIVIEQYIDGQSLEQIILENGVISEAGVVLMICDICKALEHLHSFKPPIIHRDLKLSNVMVSVDGIIKLIDYDVARFSGGEASNDTHILGTAGYAAPEQFGFTQTDSRSDIYSLGVLMNYLLTGSYLNECAYEGKLKHIIMKCTNIDPDNRYQSVNQIYEELCKYKINKKMPVSYKNWLPPGFRTGKLWKGIIAVLVYIFVVKVGLSYKISSSHNYYLDIFSKAITIVFLLSLILLYFNYLNIKEKLQFFDSENRLVKVWGYIVFTFILFCLYFGVLLILSTIMS